MDVLKAIKTKRAVRQFKPQPLPEDSIKIILNAGRRSQSSKNSQPWRFIAVDDKSVLEKLSKLGTYAGHLAGAAMAVAILTPDPDQRYSIMFDAGQASSYMQLAAWDLGIGSCIATIYEPEKAREVLGFPADWHVRLCISFGYPLDEETLSLPPKKGGREPLEDVVHRNHW